MAREESTRPAVGAGDALIALTLLVLGSAEVALRGVDGGDPLAAHALWAAVAVAALFRRSHPIAFALVAVASVALRYRFGLTPTGGAVYAITTPLALFGLGAYGGDLRRSLLLAGGAIVALEAVSVANVAAGHGPLVGIPAAEWLGQLSIYLAAAGGGIALRDRSESLAAARRRAESVPGEEAAVGGALDGERARIARELQALVAACVRDVLAAAGRARAGLSSAGGATADELGHIAGRSREAMAEMRRMLTLLRRPAEADEPSASAPAVASPTPERLDELARALGETEDTRRAANRSRWRVDVRRGGLPVLVLAIGITEAFLTAGHPSGLYGTAPLAVKLLGAIALAAAFVPRRSHPLLSAIAIAVLLIVRVAVLDDFFTLNLAIYLGAFCAGAYGRPIAVAAAGGLIVLCGGLSVPPLVDYELPFGAYLSTVVVTLAAWLTGLAGRRRLAEADQLHELAEAEERSRRLAVERALATERLEIARELHDVIGHGLTSITLGATAAERLLADRPDAAREAIGSIQLAGATVERELELLLAALAGRAEAPPPQLAELTRNLAAGDGFTSTPVAVEIEGDLEAVAPGQSGVASRVIAEAVHNARKHGGGRIEVLIEVDQDALSLVVRNPLAPAQPHRGGGLGLIGMRERVALYDGELNAGPVGDAWEVRATLPLELRPAELPSPVAPTPVA